MALFDFFKKKKQEEEMDKTITLETPVFDPPVVESQPEIQTESVLQGSGIVENSVTPAIEEPIQNNIEPVMEVEPLPANPEVIPVGANENSFENVNPIHNFPEPSSQTPPAPTVIEPVSAETVVPESEYVTENTTTSIENPTAEIAETATVVEEPNDDDPKFCPNCGNMENGGTIICSNCGSRL